MVMEAWEGNGGNQADNSQSAMQLDRELQLEYF